MLPSLDPDETQRSTNYKYYKQIYDLIIYAM